MIITLPIPGFVSVVGLAILGLPGDGVQFAPGLPTSLINFAFFLLRELFVGDEFLHGYLVAAPNILIDNRKTPITGGEQMHNGCKFLDDGNYVFTQEEMEEFIKADPKAAQFIRPYLGAQNFISGEPLYCIWLKDADLMEVKKSKSVMDRIDKVYNFRKSCKSEDTQKYADRPMLPTRLAYYSNDQHTDALSASWLASGEPTANAARGSR